MSNDILEDIGLKIQELVMAEFQNALTSDWFSRAVRDEVEAVYEDGHCECCDQGVVKESEALRERMDKDDELKEMASKQLVGQFWAEVGPELASMHSWLMACGELVTGLEKRVTELEGEQ